MTETTVTIRQTDSPSRSKQAGPCWIRIGDVYASTAARAVDASPGEHITAEGKAILRRATRISTERETWRLVVTGDPADTVTLTVGSGQCVEAVVTGVKRA